MADTNLTVLANSSVANSTIADSEVKFSNFITNSNKLQFNFSFFYKGFDIEWETIGPAIAICLMALSVLLAGGVIILWVRRSGPSPTYTPGRTDQSHTET